MLPRLLRRLPKATSSATQRLLPNAAPVVPAIRFQPLLAQPSHALSTTIMHRGLNNKQLEEGFKFLHTMALRINSAEYDYQYADAYKDLVALAKKENSLHESLHSDAAKLKVELLAFINLPSTQSKTIAAYANKYQQLPRKELLPLIQTLRVKSLLRNDVTEIDRVNRLTAARIALHGKDNIVIVFNRGLIAAKIIESAQKAGYATVAILPESDRGNSLVEDFADGTFGLETGALYIADKDFKNLDAYFAETKHFIDNLPHVYLDPIGGVHALGVQTARQKGYRHALGSLVHPGYGGFAEDSRLPAQLRPNAQEIETGRRTPIFIGPPEHAMKALGSKDEARITAKACGVPVIPGYDGQVQDIETLVLVVDGMGGYPITLSHKAETTKEFTIRDQADLRAKCAALNGKVTLKNAKTSYQCDAKQIDTLIAVTEGIGGYPIMRKGVLGGGGTDVTKIVDEHHLREQHTARPGHVVLEKFVIAAHHEIQIFGDEHEDVVNMTERECSPQRFNQKVSEAGRTYTVSAAENPYFESMVKHAVALVKSKKYPGAVTVEFLRDVQPEKGFYFLECNTRLQVEHPMTALLFLQEVSAAFGGLDFIALQIWIAKGGKLKDFFSNELAKVGVPSAGLSTQNMVDELIKRAPNKYVVEFRVNAGVLEVRGGKVLEESVDGTISELYVPPNDEKGRVDLGVKLGTRVDTFRYNPTLALVQGMSNISWAEAYANAREKINAMRIGGVPTNIAWLNFLIDHLQKTPLNQFNIHMCREVIDPVFIAQGGVYQSPQPKSKAAMVVEPVMPEPPARMRLGFSRGSDN